MSISWFKEKRKSITPIKKEVLTIAVSRSQIKFSEDFIKALSNNLKVDIGVDTTNKYLLIKQTLGEGRLIQTTGLNGKGVIVYSSVSLKEFLSKYISLGMYLFTYNPNEKYYEGQLLEIGEKL